MRYACLEPLNTAQLIARAAYLRVSDTAADWFREFGGVLCLPEAFDVSGGGWLEAEREIDKAAKGLEIEKTMRLCKRYERRALAFFEAWRKKLEKQKGAVTA